MTIARWMAAATALAAGDAYGADAVRMPTADQVEAYVRQSWPSEYSQRIGRRSGEPAAVDLLSVNSVACSDYFGHPDCTFVVTARFADGRQRAVPLSATFEWTRDDELSEVIVMIHERKVGR